MVSAGEHGTEEAKCGRHLLKDWLADKRRSSSIAAQGSPDEQAQDCLGRGGASCGSSA